LDDDDDGGGKIDLPPMGDVDEGPDDVATSRRTTSAGGRQDELLLNLSQIHVCLGDLGSCVEDYEQVLSLRTGVIGRYDKKVADCHFGLAQAGGGGGDGAALPMTEERKAEYRDLNARPAPCCVLVNQGRIRGHPLQTAAARRRTMRSAAP